MKTANSNDYVKTIMDLILFRELIETTWARCDLEEIEKLIEIIKFYYQFTKTTKRERHIPSL